MVQGNIERREITKRAGIIFILLLIIFTALNIGVGPPEILQGKIIAVGVDSSSKYELPKPILTVELEDGNKITIEGVRDVNISVGDVIEVNRRKRFITSGFEYKYKKVVK